MARLPSASKISPHKGQRQIATADALKTAIAKQRSRAFKGGLILSNAWIASAYWTFAGLMLSAQETSTASFTGSVQALIASVVSAVVVAGCCALLLGFSSAGEHHE